MDPNYNGNGMVFGGDNSFFSFDPSTLDHQPTGETILNDTEDDYLSTFFDNPNMAQQVDGFDSMFNLGGKSTSQGPFSATPFGQNINNLDPSSLDPSQPAYQSVMHMNSMAGHHHNQHHQQHQQQQQQQQPNYPQHAGFLADSTSQTHTQTMNNADLNAASSLYGFAHKNTPQQLNFAPANSGGQVAGSWGNLTVAQTSNMPLGSGSAGYSDAPSAAGRRTSFTAHAHPQAPWSGNGDLSHASPAQHVRGADTHFLAQPHMFGVAQPQPLPRHQSQQRFPGVDFGSDPSFNSNTHYQADKVRGPYGPHAMANQQTNQQNGGGSWGTFSAPGFSRPAEDDELNSGSQARKRHKGNDDRDSEHSWDRRSAQHRSDGSQVIKQEQTDDEPSMLATSGSAIISPSAGKRRRHTEGQTSQVSNSPPANQDDDGGEASARKRGAKKRENLTEDQKRKNHIHSEKKRREIIQQGYADLNKLVPCLANGKSGLSRSECLHEIGAYLESTRMGNAKLEEMLGDDLDENDPALLAVQAEWAAATARIE
ncbi:uncharacterized protein RCC_03115 [Ramularia collo-cygni]|uniref:BHLH domain-containing protein n=1 Tax=Ramularia collo-cygni TaxID=112498 RepID=A0A2D3UPI3_9PEZI|nr:uncharacterized protein RCC_03115 [Ramularia collo-cygni]CZT17281.1 uncharacterized protein RCC_03115 [Ramularia collo-cygni]